MPSTTPDLRIATDGRCSSGVGRPRGGAARRRFLDRCRRLGVRRASSTLGCSAAPRASPHRIERFRPRGWRRPRPGTGNRAAAPSVYPRPRFSAQARLDRPRPDTGSGACCPPSVTAARPRRRQADPAAPWWIAGARSRGRHRKPWNRQPGRLGANSSAGPVRAARARPTRLRRSGLAARVRAGGLSVGGARERAPRRRWHGRCDTAGPGSAGLPFSPSAICASWRPRLPARIRDRAATKRRLRPQ